MSEEIKDEPVPEQKRLIPVIGKRRIGQFRISEHFVKEYPEDVLKCLSECLVIRCEMRWDTLTFDYVALSAHFDAVPEWMIPPTYQALLEKINISGEGEEPRYETIFKGFSQVEPTE